MDSASSRKSRIQLFEVLIDHMSIIYFITDTKGTFVHIGGKALKDLGGLAEKIIGESYCDFFQDATDFHTQINSALSGEKVEGNCYVQTRFFHNYIQPLNDNAEKIIGTIGVMIDTTEEKRAGIELEKTNQIHNALMESLPGILYLYDQEGHLVFWNRNHERMTGYTGDELKEMTLMDWYKDDEQSQQAVSIGLDNCAKTGFGEAYTNLQLKDGTAMPVHVTAAPLTLNGENYFVGVGMDLTIRKEAEMKLEELNKNLEKIVEERTTDLTAANQELIAMNEEMLALNEELSNSNTTLKEMQSYLVESEKMAALGGLVAGVAHEVNTPLGIGITSSSYLLERTKELTELFESDKLSKAELERYLEDIQDASKMILSNLTRAGQLVQNFKQLSADQSNEEMRVFNLSNYLSDTLISLGPSFKNRPIDIETICDEDIEVFGEPGAFAQIITNLIMNSIKHAFPNRSGKIVISIENVDNHILMVYKDNGIGMSRELLDNIYTPFFSGNKSQNGSGLGLSIVYTLVTQKFYGHIDCVSNPNKGTEFRITFNKNMKLNYI